MKALLIPGTATSNPQPAILPPSHYLAFITTLAIHPTLTTRAKSPDRTEAGILALEYLKLVLHHVGPSNESLQDALIVSGQAKTNGRRAPKRRRTTSGDVSPTFELGESIDSELANTGSLWTRAESFWQIVGWTFSCSVLHKHRWGRWSSLLGFIMNILELDWDRRRRGVGDEALGQSLIIKYIKSDRAVAGNERKILRAIFADGQPKAVTEFGEIWPNETKALRKDDGGKKAGTKINIEADDYGDYMEDENDADLADSESERLSPPAARNANPNRSLPDFAQDLGGMESISLRIRLLSLLSKVSEAIPDAFTSLNTLYQLFFEHIRPLPIPTFFAVMSPVTLRPFDPTAASTLTQYILRAIIAAASPLPPNDNLSQDILEASYLPFAANTNSMIDNTKVSLCVETLLRLLDQYVGLEWTPGLHERTEVGIKARATKAKLKRSKKSTDEVGVCDGTWLTASADRIRMVVELAKPLG